MTDQFGSLVDPRVDPATAPVLWLPAGADVAEAVEQVLSATPEVDALTLVLGDVTLGATSRAHLARVFGFGFGEAVVYRTGEGDGHLLPGLSTGYVLLIYRCPADPGHLPQYRVSHDESNPPSCAACGRVMELSA